MPDAPPDAEARVFIWLSSLHRTSKSHPTLGWCRPTAVVESQIKEMVSSIYIVIHRGMRPQGTYWWDRRVFHALLLARSNSWRPLGWHRSIITLRHPSRVVLWRTSLSLIWIHAGYVRTTDKHLNWDSNPFGCERMNTVKMSVDCIWLLTLANH